MDTMTESDYLNQIQATLDALEEYVEELDEDIDMKSSDGMLTLLFPSGEQLILNRQRAAHQLWLATPEQGLHFDFDTEQDNWMEDREGRSIDTVLSEEFSTLLDRDISIQLAE